MSLMGGISATEIQETVKGIKEGKKKSFDKLSDYLNRGSISAERYTIIMEMYGDEYKRKRKYNIRERIYAVIFFLATVITLNVSTLLAGGISVFILITFLSYNFFTTKDLLSREYEIDKLKQSNIELDLIADKYKREIQYLKSKIETE